MNPLQALSTLLGRGASVIGNDLHTVGNAALLALGAHPAINFPMSHAGGPDGTFGGATPPMMVGTPLGLVPYASTIGNDKPYAGSTRPAGSRGHLAAPLRPLAPLSPALLQPKPVLPTFHNPNLGQNNVNLQMTDPQNSLAPLPQGSSFNAGMIPLQASQGPQPQWQAYQSPQQPYMQ